MDYQVLRLSIAKEQMHIPPHWSQPPEVVKNAYIRNWSVFSYNWVVSALCPQQLLMSSLKQLSLAKIWFLCDVLEQGRILSDEEANFFINGGKLWM
jgi:hypothetical protein